MCLQMHPNTAVVSMSISAIAWVWWTSEVVTSVYWCFSATVHCIIASRPCSRCTSISYTETVPILAPLRRKQLTTSMWRQLMARSRGLVPLMSSCSTSAPRSIRHQTWTNIPSTCSAMTAADITLYDITAYHHRIVLYWVHKFIAHLTTTSSIVQHFQFLFTAR